MNFRYRVAFLCATNIVLLFALIAAPSSKAQESLLDSANLEDEVESARIGGFQFMPSASISYIQDNNLYATDSARVSDHASVLRPVIEFASDWNRHSVEFGYRGEHYRYGRIASEDHTNRQTYARAGFDLGSSARFLFEAVQGTDHESRESADDLRAPNPTRIDQSITVFGFRYAPGKVFGEIQASLTGLDFHSVRVGSVLFSQDDRDRDEDVTSFRLGYQLSESYAVFLESRRTEESYDLLVDDFGFNRDSTRRQTSIGARFDIDEIFSGELYFGSLSQRNRDPQFVSIDGDAYGAELTWHVSALTSLQFEASRSVEPTTIVDSPGADAEFLQFRVDHALRRYLTLSYVAGEGKDNFKGIQRIDDLSYREFGIDYAVSNRIGLRFYYTERSRASTEDVRFNFAKRLFGVELTGRM